MPQKDVCNPKLRISMTQIGVERGAATARHDTAASECE